MSFISSNSNDYPLFVTTVVAPMPNRPVSEPHQHRPKHHVKFSTEFEERVVEEAPRTRRAYVSHYQHTPVRQNYVVQEAEDVDDEADEFIKFEHKKFLVSEQRSLRDY
ncbi:unnamed protein product [Prunus armeniaca]|uniref:Uncharacterized protein n=1 Tax=Prunus armeniaca TaxID=36596 RepID=A0A6J5W4V8_PRUAR|nr:unnamed protein product [Prunus armeniaca]CAB4294917.1 unnamed protein product [Prunus armeniaca]